jgi:hypothetical protein
MTRRFIILLAAAALAGAGANAAFASYSDPVNGAETAATSTEGTFAGYATGSLPGYWTAVIDHTKLSPNATITGGSFSLNTYFNGSLVRVVGTFTGGTVVLEKPSTGCSNQHYGVSGFLGNVGVNSTGSGTGSFDVTLTHYRTSVFGYCVTYSATVSGSLTLDF